MSVLFQLIFAISSNIFMRVIGPSRYLSLSMLAWGGLTVGMAFVKNARELLAVRVLRVSVLHLRMTQNRLFVIGGYHPSGLFS